MVGYYEDENLCGSLISDIAVSIGSKRDRLLKELCKFKTESADCFWRERIQNEKYLPYIMMCRSREFSDFLANRLSDFLDRLLDGMNISDAVNEAYFLLHICLFKESDKLFGVYAKLADNYKKMKIHALGWVDGDVISESSQPDFLYQRHRLEESFGCETSFFSFLTDTLIMTMCNEITLDGDNETVTDRVKELFEKYPRIYKSAGFFAYFIKDNSAAYDRFAEYLDDPVNYPDIMWVIDGLSFDGKTFDQGSPTAFAGKDNEKIHFSMRLDSLDIRWYEFLTKKIISDAKHFTTVDPYAISQFCAKFSVQLLNMFNDENEYVMQLYREYFSESAVIAANKADFIGLRRCGLIQSGCDFKALCLKIAERICIGRQRYCFFTLFQCFSDIDCEVRRETAKELAAYLSENDCSDALAHQRSAFLSEAARFLNGEPSALEGTE